MVSSSHTPAISVLPNTVLLKRGALLILHNTQHSTHPWTRVLDPYPISVFDLKISTGCLQDCTDCLNFISYFSLSSLAQVEVVRETVAVRNGRRCSNSPTLASVRSYAALLVRPHDCEDTVPCCVYWGGSDCGRKLRLDFLPFSTRLHPQLQAGERKWGACVWRREPACAAFFKLQTPLA